MSKEFLKLMPEGLRYAPEHDVYGNLEGYIMVLRHYHEHPCLPEHEVFKENTTLKLKLQKAITLLEKYSIDVVEDINGLK